MFTKTRSYIATVAISALVAAGTITSPVYAKDRHDDHRGDHRGDHRDNRHGAPPAAYHQLYGPVHRGKVYVVRPDRYRVYRNVRIFRPYGPWFYGYGHYHDDASAFRFLAFTAITMALVAELNENQERAREEAQIRATTAPVGETINWTDGGATGSVTPTRDGTSSTGRYCREFQQTVTIGGKSQEAYGTACQQPDGSWEVVSTGDGQG
jgi:hypothetical protein